MQKLPLAKTENIVVQDLKGELFVYALTTHQAFTLNETLKLVYGACDGKTSFDQLKRKYQVSEDLIHFALAELKANDLLEDYQSTHFGNLSRREVIKRVGLASMVALPVIASMIAPNAVSAASLQANKTTCTTFTTRGSTECQSGRCVNSRNIDGSTTLRCCENGEGFANGSTGYAFSVVSENDCMNKASRNGLCCNRTADFTSPQTCTCT